MKDIQYIILSFARILIWKLKLGNNNQRQNQNYQQ
jgi:hypothetical protein